MDWLASATDRARQEADELMRAAAGNPEVLDDLVSRRTNGEPIAWLEDGVYAPHTSSGFRAPGNKTLVLLPNGLMAKRGLRKARGRRAP